MNKLGWVLLFLLLFCGPLGAQSKHTLSGYVTDARGEELIGANVFIHGQTRGTITNTYGFYSLTLPEGKYKIECSFIGYQSQMTDVNLNQDRQVKFRLEESTQEIQSVEVYAEGKDVNIRKVEMSTNTLPMKQIQKLPQLLGETDIIKTIQLMPGVLQSSEASGGFHVRGGGVDQNLILLDNATVYNASHAVGFLSVFNADAIKDVKLYKGGIPAEFGGRLSSILDIHMNEGNKQEFHGAGGVGTITSRMTVEGPVIPGKASFIVSGRRSYADIFLPFIKDSLASESVLYLYDLSAKVNMNLGEKDRVFLSGYFGRDVVEITDLISQDFGNATLTARWNHVFNNKLFFNSTTVYSNYRYDLGMEDDLFNVNWITNIEDYSQRFDFMYYLNPENTVKFGVQAIQHGFSPGTIEGMIDTMKVEYQIPEILSREFGVYASNEQELTSWLSIQYGLRYSYFQNIGPGQSVVFDTSDPQSYMPVDTLHFSEDTVFNTYNRGWEPRFAIRITTGPLSSVKASYNRMYQYIHLASSSTASLPLDFWFPSSPNIKPQQADQIAAGYFRNFDNNIFEASVEVFYKWYKNSIDFKDHAQLLLNDAYEGELRIGKGWSYGVEFLLRKQTGKLTGWISYTYSRSFKQIPEINHGEPYPANYDKPHDFAIVLSYDLNDRINFSGNWIYTSAPPRTMPTSRFEYGGMIAPVYSDRNTVRIFPYHRLDLAFNWRLNKVERRFNHYLNFSVYNAYMRKNPLMISFSQNDEDPLQTDATMYYLYQIVPSITYSFKF
ncbi:MAG: TonB-dependent receptor [Bacteroidales bacterium]|nr:TonB-dependent receptor [Bacteroidales bacterium]